MQLAYRSLPRLLQLAPCAPDCLVLRVIDRADAFAVRNERPCLREVERTSELEHLRRLPGLQAGEVHHGNPPVQSTSRMPRKKVTKLPPPERWRRGIYSLLVPIRKAGRVIRLPLVRPKKNQ